MAVAWLEMDATMYAAGLWKCVKERQRDRERKTERGREGRERERAREREGHCGCTSTFTNSRSFVFPTYLPTYLPLRISKIYIYYYTDSTPTSHCPPTFTSFPYFFFPPKKAPFFILDTLSKLPTSIASAAMVRLTYSVCTFPVNG